MNRPVTSLPNIPSKLPARIPLLLAALALLGASPMAIGQENPATDSTLALIRSLYEGGSYISTELESRRCLELRGLADSSRIEAEKYLSFSLIAQGKNSSAREHFLAILQLDSTFSLDPLLTSPKILSVFNSARGDFEASRVAATSGANVGGPPLQSEVTFRAMLMPGWEQLHQGRTTKGYVLLASGSVALATTIVLDFMRKDARSEYLAADTPELAQSRYETYNRLRKAEYYAGAAFLVLDGYSVLDSFFDLPPHLDVQASSPTSGIQLTLRWDM